MTVQELMKKLAKYDPEAPVLIDAGGDLYDVVELTTEQDGAPALSF